MQCKQARPLFAVFLQSYDLTDDQIRHQIRQLEKEAKEASAPQIAPITQAVFLRYCRSTLPPQSKISAHIKNSEKFGRLVRRNGGGMERLLTTLLESPQAASFWNELADSFLAQLGVSYDEATG